MTNKQSNADGSLHQDELDFLLERAFGNFGVITTCAANVSKDGKGWENELGVFSKDLLPGLSLLGEGLAEAGSLSIVQLYHGGVRSYGCDSLEDIKGPSSYSIEVKGQKVTASALSLEDIERIILDFGKAARLSYKAGFHGVEIHGAHGYLLTQFLSTKYNQRKDKYGGSLENRSRFLIEVIESIRSKVPKSFLVGIRLSPEGYGLLADEVFEFSQELDNLDINFLHISLKKYDDSFSSKSSNKTILEQYRSNISLNIPITVAGSIFEKKDALKAQELGADFVAVGRAGLGNPHWPIKVIEQNQAPLYPPYSEKHLKDSKLSPAFIDYMRNWDDFVK